MDEIEPEPPDKNEASQELFDGSSNASSPPAPPFSPVSDNIYYKSSSGSEDIACDGQAKKLKRPRVEDPSAIEKSTPVNKIHKSTGRMRYSTSDKAPFLVHVSRSDTDERSGSTMHPVRFGKFLMNSNTIGIKPDGIKRVGRNRVSVEFTKPEQANCFLICTKLFDKGYIASIPIYNITRMGVISDVPQDWTDEEVLLNIQVPDGIGKILKVRRINRKVTSQDISEWKPTQSVIATFDGQVLPTRVFACYTSLPVKLYQYPTVQCFNCCRYGHTKPKCRSKPRCSKCGENHTTDSCNKNPSCLFCCGNHLATSKDCPEQLRQKNIKTIMAEKNISYEESSKCFPSPYRSYAEVSASQTYQTQSSPPFSAPSSSGYRKTIFKSPKPNKFTPSGYDKISHQNIINSFTIPEPQNGCALQSQSQTQSSPADNVISLLLSLLTSMISSNNSIPDHVASQLLSFVNRFNGSTGYSSMEREKR